VSRMERGEFTLTVILDAPRELVWRSWTEPEQLARWWGPRGLTTPLSTIEMDVRPGGAFRLTMVSEEDGTEYPSEMEFREVTEPERLVFAWGAQRGMGPGVATVTFRDLGDRTEMTCHYAAVLPEGMHGDVEAGWNEQFGRLLEHLTAGRKS
jgi:uncharacterized protein YndB with AHSA1/START domain